MKNKVLNPTSVSVGEILESNNYGKFTVKELDHIDKNHHTKHYKVVFLDTGYETVASTGAIREGSVKDFMMPKIFGVAYLGSRKKQRNELSKKTLLIWRGMLGRCYSDVNASYCNYGKLGVTVSESWLCFDNFEEDLPNLKGYNEKDFLEGKIQLDKDLLQQNIKKENQVYSFETCMFLTPQENMTLSQADAMRTVIALSPEGQIFKINNISDFAQKMHLPSSQIYSTFNKKGEYGVRGWVFEEDSKNFSLVSLKEKQKRHFRQANKIVVARKDGKELVFRSISECSRVLKIPRNKIRIAATNKQIINDYLLELSFL